MKHFTIKWQIAIFSLLLFLFSLPKITYAYVDPGTGSYIFQILIAGFFAGIFFFKSGIKKVKTVFEQIFAGRKNKADSE
jgi:hypothetical protein